MSCSRIVVAGWLFAGLTACSTAETGRDKADLGSIESDLKLSGVGYLGKIANNETKNGYYSTPPTYRSYGFDAKGGDEITVDVKSVHGDAVAFLTDPNYEVLAANDDATPTTLDSRVTYKVPAGQSARGFRIVFRDYDLLEATFKVTLSIRNAAAETCDPANEPHKHYIGTPQQCMVIRYTCDSDQVPFSNDCGCGCEDI